jgi:hypothetical protein
MSAPVSGSRREEISMKMERDMMRRLGSRLLIGTINLENHLAISIRALHPVDASTPPNVRRAGTS